jgi:hypothetical protein
MALEQFNIVNEHPEGNLKWKGFWRRFWEVCFLLLVNLPILALWFGLVVLYNYLVFVKRYESEDDAVPGIGVCAFFAVGLGLFNGGLVYTLGYMNMDRKAVLGIAFFVSAGIHWLLLILWLVEGRHWNWLRMRKSTA